MSKAAQKGMAKANAAAMKAAVAAGMGTPDTARPSHVGHRYKLVNVCSCSATGRVPAGMVMHASGHQRQAGSSKSSHGKKGGPGAGMPGVS